MTKNAMNKKFVETLSFDHKTINFLIPYCLKLKKHMIFLHLKTTAFLGVKTPKNQIRNNLRILLNAKGRQ